jgi:outer membrane lipoprotein SlyB
MFRKEKQDNRGGEKVKTPPPSHRHGEEAGTIAGELLGAIVGSGAGPAGAVAGMVIGAAAGAIAGKVLDEDAERAHRHDDELDETIGVTKGSLGMPRPRKVK